MTLRQLAARSGYSLASMSIAESGRRVPSWPVVAAFVQSCGDDPQQWRQLWEVARVSAAPTVAVDPPPVPEPAPAKLDWWRRRPILAGALATVVLAAVFVVLSMSPPAEHDLAAGRPTTRTPAPGAAPHPVRSTGTVTLTPGEYLDLDSVTPSWNKGFAPDPSPHDLAFSPDLRTLLSANPASLSILPAGSGNAYADCLGGDYGRDPDADAIVPSLGLCVTTQAGRRALIVVAEVHRDSGSRPDRLVLHVTVWEFAPDAAYPPVPARAAYDRYACVGGPVADSVSRLPTDPRAADWYSSRPTPWGAPQCADQIWWTPYANGGVNPGNSFSWMFSTSISGIANCTIWAYYPPPPSGHSGGIAHYSVNDGLDSTAPQLAYLAVPQTDFWGTWHGLGTYQFRSGHITVTLDNSGTYVNSQHGVIAGPVHVACR